MKITRIDHKESMLTTMILEFEHVEEEYDNKTKKIKIIKKDDKGKPFLKIERITIPVYEADLIESKIATISDTQLKEMLFKEGSKVIKK